MADVRISQLSADTSPASTDVVPVSKADGTSTAKVTLQKIADFAVSSGNAVGSDNTGITNATTVSNIVKMTQTAYNNLSSYDNDTVYIIED